MVTPQRPSRGEPIGFDAMEGIFESGIIQPGGNVSLDQANQLHKMGKMLDPKTNYPLYNAPKEFFQGLGRQNIGKAVEEVIQTYEAGIEIASPLINNLYPERNSLIGGAFYASPFTPFDKQEGWTDATSEALSHFATGETSYGETINMLSKNFGDRPLAERLLLEVIADPSLIGEYKAVASGAATTAGVLSTANIFPFFGKRTDDVGTVKNIARSPELNTRLNLLEATADQELTKPLSEKALNLTKTLSPVNTTKEGLELRTLLTDKFAFINDITRQVRKKHKDDLGIDVPDNLHAEMHYNMLTAIPSQVKVQIEDIGIAIKKQLKEINPAFLNDLLLVRHVTDLKKYYPDKPLPNGYDSLSDLLGAANAMRAELGEEAFGRLENAASVVTGAYKNVLNQLEETQMISPTLAKTLRERYPNYNPIHFKDLLTDPRKSIDRVDLDRLVRDPLKFIDETTDTSQLQFIAPLEQVVPTLAQFGHMIGEQKAASSLIDSLKYLGEEVTGGIAKLKKLPIGEIRIQGLEPVPKQVENFGKDFLTKIVNPSASKMLEENVITVFEDGVKVAYKVPEDIYKAHRNIRLLHELGGNVSQNTRRVIQTIQSPYRLGWVTLNPSFIAGSMATDSITVAVMKNKLPHKMAAAIFTSLKSMFRRDEKFLDMIRHGGDPTGYIGKGSDEILRDMFALSSDSRGILALDETTRSSLFGIGNAVNSFKNLAHHTELAPRYAVWKDAIAEGKSTTRAAWEAKHALPDFQTVGTAGKWINTLWMFSNVAKQDVITFGKNLTNPKTWKRGMPTLMAVQAGLYMYNRNFPEYWDQPFSTRASLPISLPSDEYEGGEKVPHTIVTIPILRQLGMLTAINQYIFENIDKTLSEFIDEDDKISFKGTELNLNDAWASKIEDAVPGTPSNVAGTVARGLWPLATIFGSSQDRPIGMSWISSLPTEALSRMAEIFMNIDEWSGREIIPAQLKGKPIPEQFNEYTTETAKKLGEFSNFIGFGVSPFVWDHLVDDGVWSNIIELIDTGIDIIEGKTELEAIAEKVLIEMENDLDIIPPEDHPVARNIMMRDMPKELKDAIRQLEIKKERSFSIDFSEGIIPNVEGERIPIISDIVNRFFKTRNGYIREEGWIKAVEELDLDRKQTRALLDSSRNFWDSTGSLMKEEADNKINLYFNDPFNPELQGYSPEQYVGDYYEPSKISRLLQEVLINSHNLTQIRNPRDPEEQKKFNKALFTVGGQIEDTRDLSLILSSAREAIIPLDLPEAIVTDNEWKNSNKDWYSYYKKIDEYDQSVIKEFGQEAYNKMMNQINQYKSSTKLNQEADYRTLRTYWDIEEDAIKFVDNFYKDIDVRKLWNEYSLETGQRALYLKNNTDVIKEIESVKTLYRKEYLTGLRYRNLQTGNLEVVPESFSQVQLNQILENASEVEKVLVKWGHKDNVINILNESWYQSTHVPKFTDSANRHK